ncbi:MAG: hypothetical protein JXB34_05860 [Bacteroidales bacterium]|nr:hypothetical protein [Bacteroidales bacterium]
MNRNLFKNGKILLAVLWMAGFFVYLANFIELRLHYQLQQPAFLWGIDFFSHHLSYPGGIAEYLSLFLMQFFINNLPGAFVLVLLGLLFSSGLSMVVQRLKGKPVFGVLIFGLPIAVIAALAGNYLLPLAVIVKIIFSLWFLLPCMCIKTNLYLKSLFFSLLAVLTYWFAGAIALYLFSGALIICQLNQNGKAQKIFITLLIVGLSIFIPFLSYQLFFNIGQEQAYFGLLPDRPVMLRYKLNYLVYLYIGLLLVLLLLEQAVTFFGLAHQKNDKKAAVKKYALILVQALILFAASFFMVRGSYNTHLKNQILVNYYAEREQWQEVTEIALQTKGYDYKINFEFNRALFHLGLLSDKMFSYPQLIGSDALFPGKRIAGEITQMASDLYFDLGHINESLHWAYETQTLLPNSPRALKRIVVGNLIVGNYKAAGVYLEMLKQNWLYNEWTMKYEKYLNNNDLVASDSLISAKRSMMPAFFVTSGNPASNLLNLLRANQKNKMAYEYLQAYHLLNHELGYFVSHIDSLNNFGYSKLPRNFEEALLLYLTQKTDEKYADVKFTESTLNDFKGFSKTIIGSKGKKEIARPALQKYAATYWYYVMYLSPKVTKKELKTRNAR